MRSIFKILWEQLWHAEREVMDSLIQIDLEVAMKDKRHRCDEDVLRSYKKEDF